MLLVTTSHSLLRVDPESGTSVPIHRGLGLYFGIATDGERYFVAARGRMVSSAEPAEGERGRILVFDRALRLVEEMQAPFALRDLHEILWDAGRLWVTCSYDNMVAIYDASTATWEEWYPLGRTAEPPYDVNHLNSLAMVDGSLCMVAHNKGPSEMLRFDPRTRELLSREPFGNQSHNIRETGDGLITCSSGEGALVGSNGWRLEVGGFPRGLLTQGSEYYVGISEILERKDRDLSSGKVLVFDPQWRLLRTIDLPGEGLVLDIQKAPRAP
jgi:hypothetical protein